MPENPSRSISCATSRVAWRRPAMAARLISGLRDIGTLLLVLELDLLAPLNLAAFRTEVMRPVIDHEALGSRGVDHGAALFAHGSRRHHSLRLTAEGYGTSGGAAIALFV